MRLGAQSLENEKGVSLAERLEHTYVCPNKHESKIIFAADAELPELWQCRKCSEQGSLVVEGKHANLESSHDRPGRSHWEMLLERRTEKELEEILKERIAYIRARRKGGKAEI
jgi:hypothetical protein